MKKLLASVLVLAIASFACGQTPPVPTPQPTPTPAPVLPPVRVPTGPVVPPPTPLSGAVTITKDKTYYVFDSDIPCIVLTSPQGLLKVNTEQGPIKIRERFADDPSKVQTREYKGKYVYSLDPTGLGKCELLVVPYGAKVDADVIRRDLLVDDGSKPPPPEPPPEPPTPPTPVDPGIQKMIDAFRMDRQPPATAAKLAGVCHAIADIWSQDASISTNAKLFAKFSELADPILPKTTTPAIHDLIGGEIMAAHGKSATAAVDKALAKKTFTTIATQLEGVK